MTRKCYIIRNYSLFYFLVFVKSSGLVFGSWDTVAERSRNSNPFNKRIGKKIRLGCNLMFRFNCIDVLRKLSFFASVFCFVVFCCCCFWLVCVFGPVFLSLISRFCFVCFFVLFFSCFVFVFLFRLVWLIEEYQESKCMVSFRFSHHSAINTV